MHPTEPTARQSSSTGRVSRPRTPQLRWWNPLEPHKATLFCLLCQPESSSISSCLSFDDAVFSCHNDRFFDCSPMTYSVVKMRIVATKSLREVTKLTTIPCLDKVTDRANKTLFVLQHCLCPKRQEWEGENISAGHKKCVLSSSLHT